MKFLLWSDLHIDVNHKRPYVPKDLPDVDLIVIAGDICEGPAKGLKWIEKHLAGRRVLYIPGNHEYYNHRFGTWEAVAATAPPNIHMLDRGKIVIDDVTILACTLWTDYNLQRDAPLAMERARYGLNDHRNIQFGLRKWLPSDAADEHAISRTWLKENLATDGKKLVITHHAPSGRSLIQNNYVAYDLGPAYASDLEELVELADVWGHGHIHKQQDYQIGPCRVIANPHGYHSYNDTRAFQPTKVFEI